MRKIATLLLMTALGLACSDSGSNSVAPPDNISVVGVYTMQSINEQQLPYVLYRQADTTIAVLDGQMNVATDGTWTEVVNVRRVFGADTTTQAATASGPLYRAGSSLVFVYGPDNSTYYTGFLSANRMDLDADVVSVVYTK
jgi:hypothetical protein